MNSPFFRSQGQASSLVDSQGLLVNKCLVATIIRTGKGTDLQVGLADMLVTVSLLREDLVTICALVFAFCVGLQTQMNLVGFRHCGPP